MLYERSFLDVLPCLPIEWRAQLPKESVVYFVRDDEGAVLYVGRTRNLCARWEGHELFEICAGLYEHVVIAWFPCPRARLDELESEMITRFRPRFNSIRGAQTYVVPIRDDSGALSLDFWTRLAHTRYAR